MSDASTKGTRYFATRTAIYDAANLSATQTAVLLAVLAHTNGRTHECFPSVARLMSMTRLGERTVRRDIGALAKLGWLRIRKLFVNGEQQTNRYRIVIPKTQEPHEAERREREDAANPHDVGANGGRPVRPDRGGVDA